MDSATAHRSASAVGMVSGAAGAALVSAAATAGPLIGLDDPRAARFVGVVDLLLVPGLLAGRARWPGVAGRAAANLATAWYALGPVQRRMGKRDVRWRARTFAAFLVVATAGDLAVVRALREGGESPERPA